MLAVLTIITAVRWFRDWVDIFEKVGGRFGGLMEAFSDMHRAPFSEIGLCRYGID